MLAGFALHRLAARCYRRSLFPIIHFQFTLSRFPFSGISISLAFGFDVEDCGWHTAVGVSAGQGVRIRRCTGSVRKPEQALEQGRGRKQKRPASRNLQVILFYGTPEEIRTPNLLIRSQMLYPVELRVHSV